MKTLVLFLLLVIIVKPAQSQERFSVEKYNQFLEKNKDMSGQDLMNLYPAGLFEKYYISDYTKIDCRHAQSKAYRA